MEKMKSMSLLLPEKMMAEIEAKAKDMGVCREPFVRVLISKGLSQM